ncbi:MAG: hypothetical protein QW035_03325 [Candidatus Anstonellales archaeon]
MKKSALLLLAVLMLYGCVEQSTIESKNQVISSTAMLDNDGNGFNETRLYFYQTVNAKGYEIARFASTYPTDYELVIKEYKNLSDERKAQMALLIDNFKEDKQLAESSCKVNFGLNVQGNVCTDPKTCLNSCFSASCRGIDNYMREPVSYYIYDFVNKSKAIDENLVQIRVLSRSDDKEDKKKAIEKISEIKLLVSSIRANPIFFKGIGLCDPIYYNLEGLSTVAYNLADHDYIERDFMMNQVMTVKRSFSGEYIEISVRETMPEGTTPTRILTTEAKVEGKDIISKDYKISWNRGYLLSYEGKHSVMLSDAKTPVIYERAIVIFNNPIFAPLFLLLEHVFNTVGETNYYVAVGVVMGIVIVLVLFVYLVAKMMWGTIKAYIDKRPIREALLDEFGTSDLNAQQNFLIGVGFILGGLILGFTYTKPPVDNAFGIDHMLISLGSDAVGGIVGLLAAFGVVFVYLFAEDFAKGLVIGEKYYITGVNRTENTRMYEELRKNLERLKKRMEEAEKKNIDVTHEFENILSINIDKIGDLVRRPGKKEQKEAYRLIIDGKNKVDGAMTSIQSKINIAEREWPEWERYISTALVNKNVLLISSLTQIPQQWRMWAVNKYVMERPEENISIDENTLRKTTAGSRIDNYITVALSTDSIVGGFAVVRGKVESNKFKKGKLSVNTALSMRLCDYCSTLMSKMKDKMRRASGEGEKYKIGIWSTDEGSILLIINKRKAEDITDDIEKKLNRLM